MSGRRDKRGGGGHGDGEERWLLPYADMITLLLGLFIVLFAMSTINAQKFDDVRRSLSQTFKGQLITEQGAITSGSSGVLDPQAANQSSDNSAFAQRQEASDATAEAFSRTEQKLEKTAAKAFEGKLKVEQDSRGLVLDLAGDALFDPGSADLKPAARRQLVALAHELKAFGRPLEIEGHTDGQPYSGPYTDNLGLSTERANTVFRLFDEQGIDPRSMKAAGRGEYRPKKEPEFATQEVAENRRVEIHILAPGADDGGLERPGAAPPNVVGTRPAGAAAGAARRAAPGPAGSLVDRIVIVSGT